MLDDKGKEEFLAKTDNFHDGHMPIYQSTFEVKRRNPIFCKTISNAGRTKESHIERNG